MRNKDNNKRNDNCNQASTKTKTSKQNLNKGQTITPEHTCAIKITTKGMTIATRPALKQKHRLKQIFPEHDRDNITAKFMEKEYENITKQMINNLEKEMQVEDTDNTAIHISYNTLTGTLMTLLIVLILYYKKNKNKNKAENAKKQQTETINNITIKNGGEPTKTAKNRDAEELDEDSDTYDPEDEHYSQIENTKDQVQRRTHEHTDSVKDLNCAERMCQALIYVAARRGLETDDWKNEEDPPQPAIEERKTEAQEELTKPYE